jgi:hypothetical protein
MLTNTKDTQINYQELSVVNFSHFNLFLRNHWANLDQTLVEWSLVGPLPKLKQVVCPWNSRLGWFRAPCLKQLSINLHNILAQLPPQGDTISCNGTERNETKRNNFVSCFSNYYRDITILRNETIPFRVLVISYRFVRRPSYVVVVCRKLFTF